MCNTPRTARTPPAENRIPPADKRIPPPIKDVTTEPNIHQNTSELERTLRSEIESLKRSHSEQEAKTALTTIRTILGNILHNPTEDKYRRIPLTNKQFSQKVAQYPSAREILLKSGFEVDRQTAQLVFKRKDIGLVWLTCSLIDSVDMS
jgi:hypothetical protein